MMNCQDFCRMAYGKTCKDLGVAQNVITADKFDGYCLVYLDGSNCQEVQSCCSYDARNKVISSANREEIDKYRQSYTKRLARRKERKERIAKILKEEA